MLKLIKKSNTESARESTQKYTYVGVDISRDKLDICYEGECFTCENSEQGVDELVELFGAKKREVVVAYESTGWLTRYFTLRLQQRGIKQICINPSLIRSFARSMKIKAKTDKLDSRVIKLYAETAQLQPDERISEDTIRLKELESARMYYTERAAQAKTARAGLHDKLALKLNEKSIKEDEEKIQKLDGAMDKLIERNESLKQKVEYYKTIPGIGDRIAKALAIELPELGELNRGQIASLVGVAPYNNDSGEKSGKRVVRQGRKRIRKLLYMGVIAMIRRKQGVIYELYTRLREAGKASKVAIIACVRKVLIWLNSETRKRFVEREEREEGGIESNQEAPQQEACEEKEGEEKEEGKETADKKPSRQKRAGKQEGTKERKTGKQKAASQQRAAKRCRSRRSGRRG